MTPPRPDWLRSPWLHPLNDLAAIDGWLGLVSRTWSVHRTLARVVRVARETDDTRTFTLRPNGRWPGFVAGQHVTVEVELDGVRHHRTFSLSSAPGERTVAITVQRAGRVTTRMHAALRPGDVIGLSSPAGAFVLPDPAPPRLVFLAAGTGLTPVMSMLRHLAATRHAGEVWLVHAHRGAPLFHAALAAMAPRLPGLRMHRHDSARRGRPSIDELLPRSLDGEVYACGPPSFLGALLAHPRVAALADRLHVESFAPPFAAPPGGERHAVRALRSGVDFAASGGALLDDAEAAGLRPRSGCRRGVCQSCKVRKRSGVTADLRTGRLSSDADEWVSLCVSAARSPLVLDL